MTGAGAAMPGADAILLVAFGGPERPEDIRPFLEIVAAGRPIPRERLEEVARHYEAVGGRSPLPAHTRRQAEALARALADAGRPRPVYVGMRNWHPFLRETLAGMERDGRRRALGVILSAFQTEASWDRYVADVEAARKQVGPGAPEVGFVPAWGGEAGFIEAAADLAGRALAALPAGRRDVAPLVFTAHSVPVAMARASPYEAQFEAAGRRVAARLGHGAWRLAYQSRSGSPREPWLGPDVGEVLRQAAASGATDVVVAPLGFVCDHVEVLYDLDVEAARVARESGLRFHRAGTVQDHPAFIRMLADLVGREAA